MSYSSKILADSVSPDGVRLTTFLVEFPRFILAEVNTHRMLSRNSASSRAIPVKKSIEQVMLDPFIPEEFGANRPGMSADENLDDEKSRWSREEWIHACNNAIGTAKNLDRLGVHKALANRILEPFKWHTAIISGTEWDNFFALRTDKNAQPEFRKIALMMQEEFKWSAPNPIYHGNWHLPLIHWDEEADWTRGKDWDFWKKVSVGRCARVSYLTHDGVRDPEKDIELHDRLKTNGHLSPFEHVARPITHDEYVHPSVASSGNYVGWHQYRKDIPNEDNFAKVDAQ